MAPPRRARIATPDGADTDTDQESTPRPSAGRHLKKRISEAYIQDPDGSFTAEGSGSKRKEVNINDDAAEKRKRRKSAKIVMENALAGPSSEGLDGEGESSRMAKQKAQIASVALPPVIDVKMDILSTKYEEWMKLATDNKINPANSWATHLIDYFHDMSLLRNNDDNSINFQRASCTLDGCVKIWTSRVDSVGTETGKLLSNLANDGRDDDDEANGSDNPDADPSQPRKKKSHRAGATLAGNAQQLKTKKLDLEFSVDPLFKKTCADFDEGGAQGLLMNHLSLGLGSKGALRVVFDASDFMGVEEEEVIDEIEDDVDLAFLRKEFLSDFTILDSKTVAPSLAGFSFSKDTFSFDEASLFHETQLDLDDDGDDQGAPETGFDDAGAAEDFFVGDQAVNDDFYGGGDDYGGDNMSNGSVGPDGDNPGGPPGPFVPFDPRNAPKERELVMAMTDGDAEGGMMDYFDQTFLKNWAGPEHWKLRKTIRRPETNAEGSSKGAKGERKKKEAFKIDFLTPSEKSIKELSKELFAPVTKGAGINLPGTGAGAKKGKKKLGKEKEKRDDHRLPDDMHFSSKQLVTLFLKPKFSLKMRGHRVRFNENGDGEVDENFWAQAVNNAAAQNAEGDGEDGEYQVAFSNKSQKVSSFFLGAQVPFNTQFFHDDYDDGPGFDDVDGGSFAVPGAVDDDGEQDLLAATQGQTRRVRPEFVNYAKRAKRVDVRRLKDNIWKNLDIVVVDNTEESMDVDEETETKATDPAEARVFSSVIDGLQASYPREKMQEISTSFCFICLLHLANEQGLKLESSDKPVKPVEDDWDDQEEAQEEDLKKVGNIWDLKVYRDPNATRSA
ncbi:hypothetical protein HGRIS_004736 [Hohenbuehelia grisea]|uniref:Condensin complex subunit 2 n=1 Tax=Hohenbuehelia grisea TaxID=104357 RepID=A0ABR3JD83_9AGAR